MNAVGENRYQFCSENNTIIRCCTDTTLEIACHARKRYIHTSLSRVTGIDTLIEVGNCDGVARHIVVRVIDTAFDLEDLAAIGSDILAVVLRACERRC